MADHEQATAETTGTEPLLVQRPAPTAPSYRLDGSRVTLRECWWGTRTPFALVAWAVLKVVGRHVPASTDDLPVESLTPFLIDQASIPEPEREPFASASHELGQLGFRAPLFHLVRDDTHKTETLLATFSHPSKPVIARWHVRTWRQKTPAVTTRFVEFLTAQTDGGFVWSLSAKPDMLAPPSCTMIRRQGAQPRELLQLHEAAVAEAGRSTLPASSPEHILAIVNRLHEQVRDFHLARGVFRPLTAAERSATPAAPSAGESSARHPAVIAELEKIQSARSGWKGRLLILAISLAAFLIIGLKGVSWPRLVALVPILLFHELGHFLAMKAFGYRNLRMFFIPGFGAAVTGRHTSVSGWKKGLVALAGPVPGIALGVVMGLCGMVFESDWAVDAALLMLFLNTFNLLPLLPLDGGHVLQIVLFARSYVLDVAFRILAVMAMLALSIGVKSKVLMFLGIIMLVGIPHVIRVGKTVKQLRGEGLDAAGSDEQRVPPEIADRIADKLVESSSKPQPTRLLAQQVASVYDSLAARRPGWLAGITLLFVHGISFAIAIVFCIVFFMHQEGLLGDVIAAAARRPEHAIQTTQFRESAPAAPGTTAAGTNAVVATFTEPQEAASAYEEISREIGDGGRVSLFANTVFVHLPPNDDEVRRRWLSAMQQRTEHVFVQSEQMNASFRFQAIARSKEEAAALAEELNAYFSLPLSQPLIAPWSPLPLEPAAAQARATYAKLLDASVVWDDPELKALRDRTQAALRRGEQEEFKSLLERQTARTHELTLERLRAIQTAASDLDRGVADAYIALYEGDTEDFDAKLAERLAGYFGRVPASGPPDFTYAREGSAFHTSLVIELNYLTFGDPAAGAEAVARWLQAKNCSSIRYDVEPTETWFEEDED